MKKIFITLSIALAASLSALAQSDGNNYWFAGLGGGMNFTHDGQKYASREQSHHGAGTAVDVYVGKWFNEFAGFRAGYQGLSTSNQYIDYGKNRLDYVHGDILFNVRDWFIPYVHGGFMRIEKPGAAGGLGIMTPIQISKRVAIVPDVKALAHSNRLFNDGRRSMAYTVTGTLGLVVNLGSKKKAVETIEVPVEVIKYKTDTVIVKEVQIDTVYIERDLDDINKILSDVVLFDFDSYKLTDEAIPVLDQVAGILKRHPKADIIVEGHTDSVGSEAYNQTLSENRSNSVITYLKNQGVTCGLTPIGYGKSRPVTDNSTEELRHQNRRIEFRLK